MTKYRQGSDNVTDREIGDFWERAFMAHAESFGWRAERVPQQRGAPDVVLRREGKVVGHEIKHKKPMWCEVGKTWGCWGLENYRIELFDKWAGFNNCPVFYTIHDWSPSGSRDSRRDEIEDWTSAPLLELLKHPMQYKADWRSYHQSEFSDVKMDATVWHRFAFEPLAEVLA